MCRPPHFAVLVLVGLFSVGSNALGQVPDSRPLSGPSGPAGDLERFRSLDPADRLRAVEAHPAAKNAFQAVARGDLSVAIVERGTLDAATTADVVCQLRARSKGSAAAVIKWVVEEGTIVKKGDRLVELDDSGLRDDVAAAKVRAQAAMATATAAADEARRAKRAGDVAVRLAEIEVELAEADLKQAPEGQARRVLELKVERAKLRVEQAKDDAHGRLVKAEAEARAQLVAADVEAGRVRELDAELTNCVLRAPLDGYAVYPALSMSRFGGAGSTIAQGEPVREGQKLIRVVNLGKMVVGTRVHESQISTVRVGQTVRVQVDAMPGKELVGKVSHVSAVAAQADWARADVKVYPVTVALDDIPQGLKPGMTAELRIVTGEKKDVLRVPTAAVLRTGRAQSCFVKEGEKLVEREVAAGATDGSSVEITAGLQVGDMVLTDPSTILGNPPPRKAPVGKGPPKGR